MVNKLPEGHPWLKPFSKKAPNKGVKKQPPKDVSEKPKEEATGFTYEKVLECVRLLEANGGRL